MLRKPLRRFPSPGEVVSEMNQNLKEDYAAAMRLVRGSDVRARGARQQASYQIYSM